MGAEKEEKKKTKRKQGKKRAKEKVQTPPSTLNTLARIGAWVLAGLAALLLLALIFRDFLLTAIIERGGSWFLGTEVTIETVDTSLIHGSVVLLGIRIANPPGFDEPTAFECREITADVDLTTLFSRQLVIEKLYIQGIRTVAEYDRNDVLNAARINETMQSHLPGGNAPETSPQKPEESAGDAKSILIRDFRFSAEAFLRADRIALSLPIPLYPVEQQDLLIQSSDATLSQTLNGLTRELDVFCDSFLNAKGFFLDVGKDFVEGAGNTGNKFFRKTSETGKGFMKDAEESGKAVWDSVTNVFSK